MTSLAASCCAHLLQGESVRILAGTRPRVPAVLVSQSTQELMTDTFGKPALFRGLPAIDRRVVAWGPGADPVEFPHSAVLVSEEELIARVHEPPADPPDHPDWTVHAARPLPRGVADRPFGSRKASAVRAGYDGSACWVESLESGWLFLIPGWLIAVGGTPAALLAASRLVAPQSAGISGEPAEFPSYPRIADPLCGPGWLACGSAAMAFDPICGDGAGNAVREAILASAVIRASRRGEPADLLLAHYRARLVSGFRRHLEMASRFYLHGGTSEWWRAEAEALQRGMEWCGPDPEFRYRLAGFDLERI